MLDYLRTETHIYELPLVCIILMLIFQVQLNHIDGNSKRIKDVRRLMASAALFLGVYALWNLFNTLDLGYAFHGFYIINCIYNVAGYIFACSFYYCFLYTIKKDNKITAAALNVAHVLFVITVIVYWLCINTELFVYKPSPIDLYVMGPLDVIFYVPVYMPVIVIVINSVLAVFNKRYLAEKEEHIKALLIFGFLIVSVAAENIFKGSHFVPIGVAVGMTYCYYYSVSSFISGDELTGLDNRRQFLRDAEKRYDSNKDWGIIMLDLNDFKEINDTYGHNEGDEALKIFSDVLNYACRRKKARPYRYGGDEFVIIKDRQTEDFANEFEIIKNEIINRLNHVCVKKHKEYLLSCSMGNAVFENGLLLPDLIMAADKNLYADKKHKHKYR